MSLATLAKATSMSKSGLFAHFRSKEALQIAVIDEAERVFSDLVTRPASIEAPGMARLKALVLGYVDYAAQGPFAGGCFFAAATHEFDGRPGPVRDRLLAFVESWNTVLRSALTEAVRNGQTAPDVDVEAVIFEIGGIGLAANQRAQLSAERDRARELAHRTASQLLARISTLPS